MTDNTENIDNEYVLTAIIAIRENNKRPDIKAMKNYIHKNQIITDHNIIENRPTPKGNSCFIRKKNNTPIDVTSVQKTLQVKKCELVIFCD